MDYNIIIAMPKCTIIISIIIILVLVACEHCRSGHFHVEDIWCEIFSMYNLCDNNNIYISQKEQIVCTILHQAESAAIPWPPLYIIHKTSTQELTSLLGVHLALTYSMILMLGTV